MKPLASALTDVGGVSTSTTSVTVRTSGRVQPPKENASLREPPIELDGRVRASPLKAYS